MMRGLGRILSDPAIYGSTNRTAKVLKTLVNYVVITDRYVYKFKQPVKRFGGRIDYQTATKRRLANAKEFSINRRLSPFVHLDTVDLRELPDRTFRLGKTGKLVERGFRMRRLPESRLLSELLTKKHIHRPDVVRLAKALRRLHRKLPQPSGMHRYASPDFLQKRWKEIVDWMREPKVSRVVPKLLQRQFVAWVLKTPQLDPLIRRRASYAQRIHGDLNAENIFYVNRRFHCIDINQYMIEWGYGDPLNDLGAVAKDFDASQNINLGKILVNKYLGRHIELWQLVEIYKMYWAMIRYLVYADILGRTIKSLWQPLDIQRKLRFEKLVLHYLRIMLFSEAKNPGSSA